ncbi:autotransporter outer membrane beta-barrel domain-containing protein [Achromobacter deleyi]|uniref:autotransporter outer membrane beta-barrel domain-containing protein n=1 Tax=Achromobacter deleyi TaxID=1353891 RepID=UPI001491EF55|nr:autotransporter outer membrane beta-barrel domain-containing protein [Achromobacter deleyi]QVQ26822.1 autotransporter outer membrane beta-barrel domain-containing protein [Achromobacter deleyi]UIP22398.1 autotransporter outer membrane beta-barrel domain-containing protein [Achromobacter deleyi]
MIALPGPTPSIAQTIDGGSVVTVPGSHTSPWIFTGSMSVGNISSGTLQIGAGGFVSSGSGFIGRQTSGIGTVTVSGAGAQWIAGPGLSVGLAGKGTLNITNGGHVSSTTNTYIGAALGSTGAVTLDGLGSQLSSVEFLRVGQTGSGTLDITGGAVASNGFGYVGYETAGSGIVTVTGAGSQWNNSSELTVGRAGAGRLSIANGGLVSNTNGLIGFAANSTGSVTVDGSTSSWANSGALTVGNFGNGALTIANNATVSAVSARVAANAGSNGVINIGAAATDPAAAPGTLVLTGASPSLTLGAAGTLVFNHTDTSGSYAFAPGITGAGKLEAYSGTTVLTANNTYTGGTTIAGGILQLGNGGVTGSIVGNVANNGVLAFNRSDTMTFAGAISGTGAVNQIGAGTTVLTGASTYTGGTTITAGTLQLGNGGTTGSIVGNVMNSGTLVFDRSDTMTFAGAISGAGAVNQIGAGTTVLTGASSYTGGTTITAGTLQLGDGGVTGSIVGDVTNNGRLAFNRSDVVPFAGLVSGTGAVSQNGTGTTVLTASNSYVGGTTISAGTLQLGDGGVTGSIVGDVTNNGRLSFNRSDIVPFAGLVSGTGAVSQNGTGTTVLTASNSYTGGTTITAGTLQLGDGGATGSIVGDVTNNGTLAFNRSDVVPFAGLISGSGVVRQNGTGTTVLTADNTYTGGTTISAGTLQLGDGGVTGSIVGDVTNNGTLAFNRSDIVPFAGLISGSGAVNQNGTGTTVLTAGNTYGGATSVNAGVLQAGTVATFSPNSAVVVAGAGTLDLNGFSQSVAGATNAGLISMGTGTAPGTTLTTPNYAGQGGRIAINTYLGADSSPSDRLVINGGVASGASSVHVTNAGGLGAVTAGNGILIVDAINGGTTMTNAFTLGNPGGYAAAGPYAYTLYRSSVDGSGPQNWYLRSTVDCASAPNNPACRAPTPPPDPTPTPTPPPAPPNYRPEVSTAVATPGLALRYGETILDSLHERMGEERYFNRPVTPGGNSLAWGRIIGVTGERDGSRSGVLGSKGPDYDYKIYALQSGIDLYQKENANGSVDHAGMYAAFGRGTADVDHLDGRNAGQAAMNGVTLGSYWTHIGKEGWYVDGVVQGTRYDVDNARSPAGLNLDTRGFGFAASLETGYPFRLNDEWVLEPQAQLVFQTINLNDANDGAAKIRFSDVDSLRGRLGVRIARTVELEPDRGDKRIATTWLRASLVNEFLSDPTTQFSSQAGYVPFRADMRGLAVQLNLGADLRVKRNVSLYGSFGSEISLQGDGHSLNGKLGLKIAF